MLPSSRTGLHRHHCVSLDPAVDDVPLDWDQENGLDMLDLFGMLDVLMGPIPSSPSSLAPTPVSGMHLAVPDHPMQSSSSNAWLTDDTLGSRSPSRESSLNQCSRRSLSSASSSCSTPEPPASPTSTATKGQPGGKFPLCPEGRCGHTEQWARVRTKKKYVFFLCRHCGLGWSSYKLPGFVGGPKALCISNASNAV
eukprot:GGOE01000369.1.p1 GENE.GGOE01000369.1~~GGOE01000369.1.p1  ORF type:complete len:209 (-),score=43.04 GGOE01000369.1:365-952(-)